MKQIIYIIIFFLLLFNIYGCNRSKDQDGNSFKTVKIGDQTWMAENLNVGHYRNGDPIPQVNESDQWRKLETGAWCYYNNDSTNGEKYGKLYNWYAVIDPRGLAPVGWHIPSNDEWNQLNNYLGGDRVSGGKLKDKNSWEISNTEVSNSSGFGALAGGHRYGIGEYFDVGLKGSFWTSKEHYAYDLFYNKPFADLYYLSYNNSFLEYAYFKKSMGMSVRCIKDTLK